MNFERKNKGLKLRNGELMSPVFSWGASGELFCGVMDNVDISKRMYGRFFQKNLKSRTFLSQLREDNECTAINLFLS